MKPTRRVLQAAFVVTALAMAVGARAAELTISPGLSFNISGGARETVFSADGRWLAATSWVDPILEVFDTETGESKVRIKDATSFKKREVVLGRGEKVDVSKEAVRLLAISADGRQAAGCWGDTIFLWNLADGTRKVLWRGPRNRDDEDHVYSDSRVAAFSPDGKLLAVGRWDVSQRSSPAIVLETATGVAHSLQLDPDGTDPLRKVSTAGGFAFSPDGKTLSVAEDRANGWSGVSLWDMESFSKRRFLSLQNACGKAKSTEFSPDGATLAAAYFSYGEPNCVVLWNASTGEKKAQLTGHGTGEDVRVSYSNDGAYLTVASEGWPDRFVPSVMKGGAVALWDVRTQALAAELVEPAHPLTTPGGRFVIYQKYNTIYLDRLTGAIPKPKAPARLSAEVAFREPSGNHALDADETGALVVTVSNAGPGPAYSVYLTVSAEAPVPGLDLPAAVPAGDLEPGKSVVKDIPLKAEHAIGSQKAVLRVDAKEGNGFDAAPRRIEFQTLAFKAPKLELTAVSLGGSGVVKADELTKVSVTVRNSGDGPAQNTSLALDLGDPDIFPSGNTTAALGALEPGAARTVDFQFFVNSRFKGKALPVTLTAAEALGAYGFAKRSLGLTLGEPPAEIAPVTVAAAEARRPAAPAAPAVEDVDSPPESKVAVDPDAYAIVVGIERYRQEGLPAVDFAARDAQAVYGYLTRAMGFDPKNVILLQNEQATKTDLEKYLGPWLENRVTPASRVFVYYAGHGAPDPRTGQGFLIPYEGDPSYTDVTAFPIKQLYANLAKLPAKEILVTLDACFSGHGGRSVIAAGARPLVTVRDESSAIGPNTVVLAATGGSQISTFYPDGRHGLLTYYLLKGLKGAADLKHDGAVTTGELFAYVKPNVEREARRLNVEQTPTLSPAPEALGARSADVWVRLK